MSEWISITTRFPEHNVRVLLYAEREFANSPKMIMGCYIERFGFTSYEAHEDETLNVTHWMIPSPPKE